MGHHNGRPSIRKHLDKRDAFARMQPTLNRVRLVKEWMQSCGSDQAGYIRRYGRLRGTQIYNLDCVWLARVVSDRLTRGEQTL